MSTEPKKPASGPWRFLRVLTIGPFTATAYVTLDGNAVLSAVEAPDGKPEYHVSVSRAGAVASDELVSQVRRDFGMEEAQEDNHGPGVVRHLWLAVEPVDRKPDCHCVNEAPAGEDGPRVWRP